MNAENPKICGKHEFLEWARRQNPLSAAAIVIFVPSRRRFSINVRVADLAWCFFEHATRAIAYMKAETEAFIAKIQDAQAKAHTKEFLIGRKPTQ